VAWPHTLQINPRRSRCASARTQVSTDGVSISPLHMVSRNCSAGIRSTSTYSSASRGSGWAAGRGSTHRNGVNRLRHLTTRRGVVSAVCEAAGGGGKLGGSGGPPLCLEHTRMVGRQQPHPLAALELRLLRKLALGGVLGAPMLARIVASARQPEDQCRFRQTRLRKLAKKRDAAIGRVKDEHAHKVVAPRVPYDVEIGHPSVGIDDLPVIHCQEAPIYLTLLALHAEARVDIQTTSRRQAWAVFASSAVPRAEQLRQPLHPQRRLFCCLASPRRRRAARSAGVFECGITPFHSKEVRKQVNFGQSGSSPDTDTTARRTPATRGEVVTY